MTAADPARAARWVAPGYALALTLAITAPLLRPGYLLVRDAVSTPRSYLSDAAIGLGESAPRAVPQDFAVAVLSGIADGGLVVKALLIVGVFLAGWGAARLAEALMADAGVAGQLVAATVAVWNPYVAERLLQGHWSLLVGYGCLPWVAATVIRLRMSSQPRGWAALVFWIALAGITPTGLVLAAIVALVCLAAPGTGVRRGAGTAGVALIAATAASPWLLAAALSGALGGPQSAGLALFAARAEPGLGTLGSLAGLGGIWNSEAVPASRATLFAVLATAVLLSVVACGIPALLRRPAVRPLLALALLGVVLPAVMATAPGLAVLTALVDAAPGLAILRDGQKWAALAMPGYALAGAGAVVTLRNLMRPALTAVLCCAAVIAVLPDLAAGVGGRVVAVRYPSGWSAVAEAINADPGPVAVLPPGTMRRFAWAGTAPVLDPLPRWLRAEVLSSGDLSVAGQTVPGEGERARRIEQAILDGADAQALAADGVRWLVVESGTPGPMGGAAATLAELTPVHRDGDLSLYRIGGDAPGAPATSRAAVLGAHLLWAVLLAGGAIAAMPRWTRRRARSSRARRCR